MSDAPPLRITRRMPASARRVFDAWTDPAALARWAWAGLGTGSEAHVDLRVGGTYRVSTQEPAGEMAFHGEYLEIVPPSRLVFTVRWDAPMGYDVGDETITVAVRDAGDASEMTFTHDGVQPAEARATHEQGWGRAFDLLEQVLRG